MKQRKKLIILVFLAPLLLLAQNETSKSVLMVGNSFTYFWNMPQMVNAMAELENYPLEVRQSTLGGSSWEEHFLEKRETRTMQLLKEKKWDYVILQNHSYSSIGDPEKFIEYGNKLANSVLDSGAKPYLMMTWAYLSNPLMQEGISEKYNELAEQLGTVAIPVGELFMKARRLRPDLNLYFDDKHPSSEGSYLIALIMYKALTGNPVKNIPDRLLSRDKDGEKIYLSFIDHGTGVFLRQLVDQSEFNAKLVQE